MNKNSCCKTNLSTAPIRFQLDPNAVINKNVCNNGNIWLKQNPTIVDVESDLLGLNNSKCNKYIPNAQKNASAPQVLEQSLCPIVYNNIQRPTSIGVYPPNTNICGIEQNKDYIYKFIDCDGNAIYN